MKDETILIRARIIERQEDVLTVRLEDGFAQSQTVVHKDFALPDQQPAPSA